MSAIGNWVFGDFDGTLAHRPGGARTQALTAVLCWDALDCRAGDADIRPHLQSGFPWHEPQDAHMYLRTADQWWASLETVFVRAYQAVGLRADRAAELAGKVRALYVRPSNWVLYDDALAALRCLSRSGWQHAILSNHCPELPDIVERLGLGELS